MKVKNIYIYIYINSQNITIGIHPYNKLAKKKKKTTILKRWDICKLSDFSPRNINDNKFKEHKYEPNYL